MSIVVPSHDVVVVREADTEVVGAGPLTGRLYADSSATGGALSSLRIMLRGGAAGATPHHVVIAPGVERFEFFRHLQRIAAGEAPLASILEVQDRYDNYFDDSQAWQQALAARLA